MKFFSGNGFYFSPHLFKVADLAVNNQRFAHREALSLSIVLSNGKLADKLFLGTFESCGGKGLIYMVSGFQIL